MLTPFIRIQGVFMFIFSVIFTADEAVRAVANVNAPPSEIN